MALNQSAQWDHNRGTINFFARKNQTTTQVECAYAIGRDIAGIPQIDFPGGAQMWLLGDRAIVDIDDDRNVFLTEFPAAIYAKEYWDSMVRMAAEQWANATGSN